MQGHTGQLKTARRHMTIPIFIPHMGCPQACTFCNQNKISGTQAVPFITRSGLIEKIDSYLETAHQDLEIEVGFFGGSFTGLPRSIQDLCLSVAKSYLEGGQIHGIRLSTRPDYIDDDICTRLKSFGVSTIELGVQSFSNQVLDACLRGHSAQQAVRACQIIKEHRIELGIQLMLGLPGDAIETWHETVAQTVSLMPNCVRLYPALVISETALAQNYLKGEYTPLTLEQAVERAAYAHQLLREKAIPVIRMGLQASEDLREGSGVLAGPKHDSFRELVESYHYKQMLERDLLNGFEHLPSAVKVNPKHVSFFSGNKKSNLIWLKSCGILNLKIIKDPEIPLYSYQWLY